MKHKIRTLLFSLIFSLCCVFAFAQEKIKVACIGNSITEGSAIAEGKKYPDVLQVLLGVGYEVRNYGKGGRTVLKKGDYPYWKEQKYTDARAWTPDIVIIKLGTNDSKPQNWKYKKDFRKDYIAFVRSFRKLSSHPKVYICYPIPVFESKWGITESIVRDEIIPILKKVARKTGATIIDLYTPFTGKAAMTYDGIHPNADGARLLAEEVFKEIKN